MSCSLFCGPDSRNLGAGTFVEAQEVSPQPCLSPPPAFLTPPRNPCEFRSAPFAKGATGDFSVSAISSVFLCCLVFAQASSLWPQASSEGRSSCPLKNVYQQIV